MQTFAAPPDIPTEAPSIADTIDAAFSEWVVAPLSSVIFFDLAFWDPDVRLPLVVVCLAIAAFFFTLRLGFVNLRAFRHAIDVTLGRWDDPREHHGEVTHFQALSSALSGTLGLGNISGVAVAIGTGGPGAMVWMTLAGFLGMSSKMVECTLGMLYRDVDAGGRTIGGPMRYLVGGLAKRGWPRTGRALAVVFAILCMGGSLGGGNMFQANQAYAQVAHVVPFVDGHPWIFGLVVAFLVGIVILGGIKRIAVVAERVVPFLCLFYMLAALVILAIHAADVPAAIATIFREALTPRAGLGGAIGVAVVGFQRASFSNEAGIGSAPIAHSAATTGEPVREGIVALLEPFIDTVVVCNATAIVVVVTGVYQGGGDDGVLMTSRAFATVLPWFPHLLTIAVFLFAYATMLTWSYYGERCATWLLGPWIGESRASFGFKVVFLACTVLGSALHLGSVLEFSDLMILGMAFPNLVGLVLLTPEALAAWEDYWARFKSGAMQRPRKAEAR